MPNIPDIIYQADALLKYKIEVDDTGNSATTSTNTFPDGVNNQGYYEVTAKDQKNYHAYIHDKNKHPSGCGDMSPQLVANWCYSKEWKSDSRREGNSTVYSTYYSSILQDQYYNAEQLKNDIKSGMLNLGNAKDTYLNAINQFEAQLEKVARYTVAANQFLENYNANLKSGISSAKAEENAKVSVDSDGDGKADKLGMDFKTLTNEINEIRKELKKQGGLVEVLHNLSTKANKAGYNSKDQYGNSIDFVSAETIYNQLKSLDLKWKEEGYGDVSVPTYHLPGLNKSSGIMGAA